jgi:hypothetical protein
VRRPVEAVARDGRTQAHCYRLLKLSIVTKSLAANAVGSLFPLAGRGLG